jgi:hypothetical protein
MSSSIHPEVTIQTSSQSIPSVPSWFGEVAVIAHTLRRLNVLATIEERVRFARRRFGHYGVIDFVVVLPGYAISGERAHPFAIPFMAQIAARASSPPLNALSLSRRVGSSTGRSVAHCVSRRPGRSPSGKGGKNGRAVGPARNTVGSVRCRWHSTSYSPTRLTMHIQSPASTATIR